MTGTLNICIGQHESKPGYSSRVNLSMQIVLQGTNMSISQTAGAPSLGETSPKRRCPPLRYCDQGVSALDVDVDVDGIGFA